MAILVRQEPTSTAAVRHELARHLARRGVEAEAANDVLVVASELIGNAVQHSGAEDITELEVAWTIDAHEVLISVTDPSDAVPVRRHPAPDAVSGRGLAIIETLGAQWGVTTMSHGKRVWARVPLHTGDQSAS